MPHLAKASPAAPTSACWRILATAEGGKVRTTRCTHRDLPRPWPTGTPAFCCSPAAAVSRIDERHQPDRDFPLLHGTCLGDTRSFDWRCTTTEFTSAASRCSAATVSISNCRRFFLPSRCITQHHPLAKQAENSTRRSSAPASGAHRPQSTTCSCQAGATAILDGREPIEAVAPRSSASTGSSPMGRKAGLAPAFPAPAPGR